MMKKWSLLTAACLASFTAAAPAEQILPPQDIGTQVRGVFAAKCAGCHGADLAKPKGRFGYVLDLRRVAENPEMVIPSRPDQSELWVLVERDEMPPAESPHGGLTYAQKDIIQRWIAAGAPEALSGAADSSTSTQTDRKELTSAERFARWVGKFHLLLLHFPIALVFAAGALELWTIWRRRPVPSEAVRSCLWLGAVAAIPTAVLGWLFAASGNGVGSPQLLTAHRWLGTSAAVWLIVTAIVSERDARRQARSRSGRLLLMAGLIIIALTAHLGGLMAYGEDFFRY
jgi:uncharacterized membrane protein/mono/diheme cytochrome c family protein